MSCIHTGKESYFLRLRHTSGGSRAILGQIFGEERDGKFTCQHRLSMLTYYLLGAIAQLGERLHGMQEVVGSNPIGSIAFEVSEVLL